MAERSDTIEQLLHRVVSLLENRTAEERKHVPAPISAPPPVFTPDEFDPNCVQPDSQGVIFGAKGTGTTNVMRAICAHMFRDKIPISQSMVVGMSPDVHEKYHDWLPEQRHTNGDILQTLIQTQEATMPPILDYMNWMKRTMHADSVAQQQRILNEQLVRQGHAEQWSRDVFKQKHDEMRCKQQEEQKARDVEQVQKWDATLVTTRRPFLKLLILDGVLCPEIMRSDAMKTIVQNGTQLGIGLWCQIKYASEYPLKFHHGASDFVIITLERNPLTLERLYQLYGKIYFDTQASFEACLNVCWKNWGVMVIDMRKQDKTKAVLQYHPGLYMDIIIGK